MEQKFNNNRLDLQILREFCEREGKKIAYRKGDQLEREGDPARWFAFVTEGCFKYVKYGMSDDKAHITWFSFEGEFVCDYPTFLYGRPSQATIEAMVPTCTEGYRPAIGTILQSKHGNDETTSHDWRAHPQPITLTLS